MKKLFSLLMLAILLPLQACAQEVYTEGEHYEVISDKATDKAEVLEFFSFWCPHCHAFEPLVAQIKSKLDKNVSFEKVHANFMAFTTKDIQDEATKAMMIGRALKREDALNKAIFNYIHVQRSQVTSLKDLENIFIINGVDSAEFEKMASSFGVNSLVSKNNKALEHYRKHLGGVPTFIVNGKFKAKFTRNMGPDDMVDLIVWLSKQK
ncbi:thiol:disulfide interchange protein DsbA/DsbL [Bowmanella yangjiangensis]|uniref:Thiol:disulfide interchange protein n=1 Tax=Bowmanella yangjiangensis TaxID=2811230 RepID=A0ABS3CX62_9ALTE|nr:thiol:disulfide interchange protein DsbA/DsbL [Bowmanella yangjiangensis]MBN7821706.1 thiol:disulfide interchange protein DsbA/DsbL [Bowmanella yangjiangensis]